MSLSWCFCVLVSLDLVAWSSGEPTALWHSALRAQVGEAAGRQ